MTGATSVLMPMQLRLVDNAGRASFASKDPPGPILRLELKVPTVPMGLSPALLPEPTVALRLIAQHPTLSSGDSEK